MNQSLQNSKCMRFKICISVRITEILSYFVSLCFGDTWCSDGPLFEMAVFGTVPAYVTHVPTLETSPVLRLPLLLFNVLVFVIFLLLNPGREQVQGTTRGWINNKHSAQTHTNEQTHKKQYRLSEIRKKKILFPLKTPLNVNTYSYL